MLELAKIAVLGLLATPVTLFENISKAWAGIIVIFLAFGAGVGVAGFIGNQFGLDDRLRTVERQNVVMYEMLVDLRCSRLVDEGYYNRYRDCITVVRDIEGFQGGQN